MKQAASVINRLISFGALVALSQVSALAQTNTAQANPPAQPPPSTTSSSGSDEESRFKRGEWDVSPFATYVDKAGGKWGAGAALTYFITDKIGIGGATYWTDTGGTFIDNAEAEGYFRLPIFKRLAPYAVGSIGYQFDRQYWFETVGAGLDFRAFKHLDAFSDIQYRFSNDEDKSKGGIFLRLGVRFAF